MARGRKRTRQQPLFDDLTAQTKQAIGAVGFAALGVFFVLAALDTAGVAGTLAHDAVVFLFGYGFVLLPLACVLAIYVLMRPRENEQVSVAKAFGIVFLFIALLVLVGLLNDGGGGVVGSAFATPLLWLFGSVGSVVALVALALIGIFLTFNTGFFIPPLLRGDSRRASTKEEDEEEVALALPQQEEAAHKESDDDAADDAAPERTSPSLTARIKNATKTALSLSHSEGTYVPPPLSLLQKDKGKARVGDVKASANIIKRTLRNFHIEVEMDEVSIGPSVTRYALKPAEGVRISKIVGLQNNLELALAASPIRIEAPIPGKSLVGIEVPNTAKTMIGLATLLNSPEFTDSPKPLMVALGKDITGMPHFADIAKMPHTLIAGTTGSGKSVMIHNLITSLLFRNSPMQLRFILVDPKRVELTLYSGIPHLLSPVITDAKHTLQALKWAIKEMERRYDILQTQKVRDISAYHNEVYEPARAKYEKRGAKEDGDEEAALPEPMPYLVVIIDELSDLMSAYPRELESLIVRLAQMSRAVGIHLILATQRPEVRVITGLIKANIPCRLAFKVNSQIDSRTIIDSVGAEKLLGHGDMLFVSPERTKPLRLQSSYVSTDELKRVVTHLKDNSAPPALDALSLDEEAARTDPIFAAMEEEDAEEDDLYNEAKETVVHAGKASTSFLQRKLGVGYARAARLIDLLEERGVVGPGNGAKPREVLLRPGAEDAA